MHELLVVDLGPGFFGFHGQVAGKVVCVATPKVKYDAQARRKVRSLIERQGGSCADCQNCVIGSQGS